MTTMTETDDDAFILDLERLFGDRVRADNAFAYDLYCAIAQVDWEHPTKGRSGFTYRGAEAVLDEIGRRDMKLYIEPDSGTVSEEISTALRHLGWRWLSLTAGEQQR